MMDSDPWVLPSSHSRLSGEAAERFEQKRNAVRRWTNGLISISYMLAVEDVIAESSRGKP